MHSFSIDVHRKGEDIEDRSDPFLCNESLSHIKSNEEW